MKVSVQGTGDALSVPIPPDVPSLEELVIRITPENRHEEIDFGPPVGKEVW